MSNDIILQRSQRAKIQQSSEYNKTEADVENNPVFTSGGWGEER